LHREPLSLATKANLIEAKLLKKGYIESCYKIFQFSRSASESAFLIYTKSYLLNYFY